MNPMVQSYLNITADDKADEFSREINWYLTIYEEKQSPTSCLE